MESATLSHRNITIDGMTGDACVKKVTTALDGVKDIKTESVKVGSASINSSQDGCAAACKAIDNAGFTSHCKMDATQHGDKASTPDASKTQHKPDGAAYKGIGEHAPKAANGHAPAAAPATTPAKPGVAPAIPAQHKA
ncbi:MAG: hypothetical protein WC718_02520 [Phycisphaerales bacterium]|jgi:copper chaperone CopZ